MTISIVIPAFNCSGSLKSVVTSILASGLCPLEILIVNDGSSDDTGVIAKQLESSFDGVRVIDQPNKGVSAARNRGIQEAVGDYVFFVDADDSLIPGSLADVNSIIDAEHPDIMMFGMCFDYYTHGRIYRSDTLSYPTSGIMEPAEWGKNFETLFACNMLSPVWNKLIRRDLILDNRIEFREDMIEMEDYLFSAQCLLCSEQIYVLDKAVYRYRQSENERNTFERLWRIKSLSRYVQPFYETAEALEARFSGNNIDCGAGNIADQIYSSLFHEKLRYASLRQNSLAASDMLRGRHAHVIARTNPNLYNKLKKKQYGRVWCERMLRRARHYLAVQVKYIMSLRNRR